MTELFPAGSMSFEGGAFPVFVGDDRRVYARFIDLCTLLGLEWRRCLLRIEQEPGLAAHFIPFSEADGPGRRMRYALFMNLAALPQWAGSLRPRLMKGAEVRERVMKFARQFMAVPWLLVEQGYEVSPPAEDSSWLERRGL